MRDEEHVSGFPEHPGRGRRIRARPSRARAGGGGGARGGGWHTGGHLYLFARASVRFSNPLETPLEIVAVGVGKKTLMLEPSYQDSRGYAQPICILDQQLLAVDRSIGNLGKGRRRNQEVRSPLVGFLLLLSLVISSLHEEEPLPVDKYMGGFIK